MQTRPGAAPGRVFLWATSRRLHHSSACGIVPVAYYSAAIDRNRDRICSGRKSMYIVHGRSTHSRQQLSPIAVDGTCHEHLHLLLTPGSDLWLLPSDDDNDAAGEDEDDKKGLGMSHLIPLPADTSMLVAATKGRF